MQSHHCPAWDWTDELNMRQTQFLCSIPSLYSVFIFTYFPIQISKFLSAYHPPPKIPNTFQKPTEATEHPDQFNTTWTYCHFQCPLPDKLPFLSLHSFHLFHVAYSPCGSANWDLSRQGSPCLPKMPHSYLQQNKYTENCSSSPEFTAITLWGCLLGRDLNPGDVGDRENNSLSEYS